MLDKLQHALALAEMGFYVFPCEENGSTPIVKWRNLSTRDPAVIRSWWTCPVMGWIHGYNVGIDCGKSGLNVVDIDCKDGKKGRETLAKWQEEHSFPATYTTRTPSGGIHFYFRATGYGNTQGDSPKSIGAGVDTRGEGGYVLAVGSERNGVEYTLTDDSDIADQPLWLGELLANCKANVITAAKGETYIEDHEDDIARAVTYLTEDAEPAVEGAGGDHQTYAVACMVKDFGISREKAVELMYEHYNERCSPPWNYDDLEKKVNSAYRSAQSATGSKSAFAEFTPVATADGVKFMADFSFIKTSDIPRRAWCWGNVCMRGQVTIAVASAGIGKSTFTLGMALSKVTGRNLLGFNPHGKGAVAVWNNEDDMQELERRVRAAMQFYRIADEELYGEQILGAAQPCLLKMNSGADRPFSIAKRQGPLGKLVPADADMLVEYLLENNIEIFIIDPLTETHPANENSNEEMRDIGRMYRYVAQRANCAVVLVHHSRKPDGASSEGQSGKMESARGASSLAGVARIMFTLTGMTEKQSKLLGIADEMRSKYILYETAKANMSAPGGSQQWFERYGEVINASIDDPDGEQVGVLKPIKLVAKKLGANAELQTLINNIAILVSDEAKPIKTIAKSLSESCVEHYGKKPESLDKAIRRLFDDGAVPCERGMLSLEELPGKPRSIRLSGVSISASVTSIEQLL